MGEIKTGVFYRRTQYREIISGKQVDVFTDGNHPDESIKKDIENRIAAGKTSGTGSTYTWIIPFEGIKVGDRVIFSTTWKYNPGFHSTQTYVGTVLFVDDDKVWIECDNFKKAIVKIKHIEEVLS